MELVFVLFEMWQRCSDDEASETVPNESQTTKLRARARFPNILMHFVSQFLPHFKNVVIRVLLVCLSTEEQSIWQRNRNNILENTHIKG